MSARKYKPALYELIGKGPLKPDQQGALRTPRWFYDKGSKRGGAANGGVVTGKAPAAQQGAAAPEKPSATVEAPAAAAEVMRPQAAAAGGVENVAPAPAAQARPARPVQTARMVPATVRPPQPRENRPERSFGFVTDRGRVLVTAPYWGAAVIVLGLLFGLLLAYRIGKGGGASEVPAEPVAEVAAQGEDERLAQQSRQELSEVRQSPARPEVLGRARPVEASQPVTRPAQQSSPPAVEPASGVAGGPRQVQASAGPVVPERTLGTPTGAYVLIMCGSSNRRELLPVQEYFSRQGLLTQIGRTGSRYVVYSAAGVESTRAAEADEIKKLVARYGARYNEEKPASAPSFTPKTFESAFWMRRDALALSE